MGAIHEPSRVLLVIAVSSRYDEALAWAQERCIETDYYRETMGDDLKKQFLAFKQWIDPGDVADIKRTTNNWEAEYAALGMHPDSRPLNLDPGYITPAKLVLASTKDHAHRVYLKHGIYAEVTLQYRDKTWQALPWTYPDYRRADYQAFFSECREQLRRRPGSS